MHRGSVLCAVLIGFLTLGPTAVAAQESAATPVATTNPFLPAPTPPAMPAPAEFVGEIALADPSSSPAGVAVDAGGTLYVVDGPNDHILLFDRAGQPVATWGVTGSGPGQFRFAEEAEDIWGDLAFGPDGNLYVVDPFNSRVQVLGPDGAFLREWGEPGAGEGQFDLPSGIGIDGAGRVYVAEYGNKRVQVFDGEGRFLAAWAPSEAAGGPFTGPGDVAVDAAGFVWVTDWGTNRVYRFDPAGAVVGAQGDQPGQLARPWGAAVDAGGNLYVAEWEGSRVQVFAPDGISLGTIGSLGMQPGQFLSPIYPTVGPDGRLYVADEGNRRVQVFRLLPPLGLATGTPVP
jgi:DNA-binding beta-propeller fold protein YncE